jgi:integrase
MPRISIDKATVRNQLAPRREPYWGAPIAQGLFLGFRRIEFGGTWIARLHDADKRHRYHSVGVLSADLDYEAARKAAIAWKRTVDAGVKVVDVETVADACREYVQDREKLKGAATAHDADLRFRRTIYDDPIGRLPLGRLTQKRIEEWRDTLASGADGVKPLSPASLNRTLTALKAALNYAIARRYVSPERAIEWGMVKPFKVDNRRDLFLDLAQRRALLQHASGAVRDLIEAVMLTGTRAGELTSAKRSQFDDRTASMTFIGKTGKRSVPLSPQSVILFKRIAQGKQPAAHLFTRDDGKPWAASDWDGLVRAAAQSAGLPAGVCLYTLRHSFITEAITGGLSPLDVARFVGTSLVMIDKHYGHLAHTAARERLGMMTFV